MTDLMYYFDELMGSGKSKSKNKTRRAPFSYVGSKYKSINKILPHLPYRKGYIEVFGGSGVVMLNRPATQLDVFNDLHSGVTAFYKCMHDDEKFDRLMDKLEMTIHSREFWNWCHETWEKEDNDVDRAFKWYYTVRFSFGHIGRNFARVVKGENKESQRIFQSMPLFKMAHERFRDVIVENRDCNILMSEYDHPDHVFYLDPPYLKTWQSVYRTSKQSFEMDEKQHKNLLELIFNMKAYVAISGYSNELYDQYDWDEEYTWKGQHLIDDRDERANKEITECLWIKKERK